MNRYKVTHYNVLAGINGQRVEIVEAPTAAEALALGCNRVILLSNGYTWKGEAGDVSNAHTQRRDGRVGSFAVQI